MSTSAVKLACPHCGKKLGFKRAPAEGTKFRCPGCQGQIIYSTRDPEPEFDQPAFVPVNWASPVSNQSPSGRGPSFNPKPTKNPAGSPSRKTIRWGVVAGSVFAVVGITMAVAFIAAVVSYEPEPAMPGDYVVVRSLGHEIAWAAWAEVVGDDQVVCDRLIEVQKPGYFRQLKAWVTLGAFGSLLNGTEAQVIERKHSCLKIRIESGAHEYQEAWIRSEDVRVE